MPEGLLRVPIFPLAGALLLPRAQLPLHIFEPRYRIMVRDALASDQLPIARLEDVQRQRDAGAEHRMQREER